MKKTILVVSVLLAMTSAMSQGLGGLRMRRAQRNAQLLETLLPFSEAVEKAKAGNAQGWYALAVHYAKGDDVDCDSKKARQFMLKASDMNYSNAVFVAAMMLDADCAMPLIHCCGGTKRVPPPFEMYVGCNFPVNNQSTLCITNAADIATIRAEYERAFNLGVTVATNELARFERKVSSYQEEAKKDADEKKRKAENAKIAESLLIDLAPSNK